MPLFVAEIADRVIEHFGTAKPAPVAIVFTSDAGSIVQCHALHHHPREVEPALGKLEHRTELGFGEL